MNKKIDKKNKVLGNFSFFGINWQLACIILLGLILRLYLATLPGFKIDVDAWFAWADRLLAEGFPHFYSDQVWTNYTPGFLYVLAFLQIIKNIFHLSTDAFYFLIKVPTIIAEIILTAVIFNKVRQWKNTFWAYIAAISIALNPAIFFNSAVWGQVDGFLTLFMILSIIALEGKRLIWSSLFFAIALLIKPQALAIAPIYLLFVLKHFSFSNLAKISLPGILLFFLAFFPFFPTNPIFGPINLVFKMVGDYPYTSLFAYNFWGIFGFWGADTQKFMAFTYREWGLILLIIFWVITAFLYLKRGMNLYVLASFATLFFYFLPTRVHERYLYPAIPFLILASFSVKSRTAFYLTVALSLTFFADMYYVYIYYNHFFLKFSQALYIDWFFNFLDKNQKLMSILSTLLFGLISVIFLKRSYDKKA